MSRLVLGPFNRVEGDLEVQLDTANGVVRSAWVNSPLYRGFEQILIGKAPEDALVYTPRICGICSVSQSVAAARALADAYGQQVPANGIHAINLIHANENLVDHLTHFYLFFMPDFARDDYAGHPWHRETVARFKAISGSAAPEYLEARARFMHLMGLLAGKWPHSLAIQPGGSTRSLSARERLQVMNIIDAFRRFLEGRLFGANLEEIASLDSPAALAHWRERQAAAPSDFARFLDIADDTRLADLGRATDRFLSFGSYPDPDGHHHFRRGIWHEGLWGALDIAAITEDVSHSWMAGNDGARPPADGLTQPDPKRPGAYTWSKAPRLAGDVVEVGALARQLIAGQPLIDALVAESGGNVRNRVIGRLLETARAVLAMNTWANALIPNEPFFATGQQPREAEGVGLTEAARGSLGHWIRIENGRISNYQIISPTTWNFSPRDADGVPGALEQALAGTPVTEGDRNPVAVQHIVRSFDPCMVCTVH